MITAIILLSVVIIFTVIIIILFLTNNMEVFFVSLAVEFVLILINYLYAKLKFCKYGFNLKFYEIFKPNTDIRISASYLYRIEIKGRYFLVKNRKRNVFQPIGGVYKYYNSAKNFLNEIEYKPDSKIKIDDISKNDLRIYVKAKYLTKFLDLFYSKKDRECDYLREFNEEAIKTKVLSDDFKDIKPKYIKKIKNKIEYSKFFNCYELKPKDIIEIELSDKQNDELDKLSQINSNEYFFATQTEILNNGITEDSQEIKFGDHTKYIL